MAALKHPCVGDLTYGADPVARRSGSGCSGSGCTPSGSASSTPTPGSTSSTSRPTPTTWPPPSRSSARRTDGRPTPTPATGCGCARTTAGDVATSSPRSRRGRGRAADAAGRARRRRGAGLAGRLGWPTGRGLGRRAGRRPGRLRPADRDLARRPVRRCPTRAGRGRRLGAARPGQGRCARAGFWLWVFETNTPARGVLRAPRAGRARAHRRRRPTRSARPTSGWPGRGRTRWRSSAACIDEVDGQLGDLLARRVALTGAVQDAQERQPAATPTASGRSPRRWPPTRPSSGAERLGRIMHAVITESLDAAARASRTRRDRSVDSEPS